MKTACIYHSIDLDGWMSAAVVKHWFVKNNKEYFITDEDKGLVEKNSIGFGNQLHFIGYNYGQPIPDSIEFDFDKVIMCDISLPNPNMYNIAIHKELTWIDHHISAIKLVENYDWDNIDRILGIRDTKFAACELTWQYFFPDEPMPELVRLLGRYDCFGSKGTDEHQKVLQFQYGARQSITNYNEAYGHLMYSLKPVKYNKQIINGFNTYETIEDKLLQSGKYIYQYLCTEAKQSYKNGFEIELIESYDGIGAKRKFICINKERFNPINFGIDYHQDGYDGAACFHYANGKFNFNLYNDNEKVDCSVIAKQFGGGGHKGASGFVANMDVFQKII